MKNSTMITSPETRGHFENDKYEYEICFHIFQQYTPNLRNRHPRRGLQV